MTPEPPPLPLTGERTVPGVALETYWFERHVAAYRFAGRLARGARVLDAGCGEGYGLVLLAADGAASVVGVELDPAVADHARARYATDEPPITVIAADLADLPLADRTVELTVSLQVVEHLADARTCLAELARVTDAGGTLVVSTPNRLTFSPGGAPPTNPFHVREYAPDELTRLLTETGLGDVRVLGLRHGPRLAALERDHGTSIVAELIARGPAGWPTWLTALVPTVTADDFVIDAADPADALDLIAVATAGAPA